MILLKFINSEVDFAWLIEDKLPCLPVSLFYGMAICLDWLRVLLASGVAPTYAIPLKEFTVSTKVRIYLIYQVMHLASMYSTRSGHCTILLNLLSLRNYQSGGITFLTDAVSSTSRPHTVTCKALRRSSVQFSRLVIFTVTSVPVGVCRARWTEVRLSNPLPGIRHKAHGSNQSRKKVDAVYFSKI